MFEFIFSVLHAFPASVFTACGVLGFLLYLTNYTLISFHIISSQDIKFFVLNISGATLVLLSLWHSFNLGSFLIQVFWICMGFVAIGIRMKPRADYQNGGD